MILINPVLDLEELFKELKKEIKNLLEASEQEHLGRDLLIVPYLALVQHTMLRMLGKKGITACSIQQKSLQVAKRLAHFCANWTVVSK